MSAIERKTTLTDDYRPRLGSSDGGDEIIRKTSLAEDGGINDMIKADELGKRWGEKFDLL